MRSRSGSCADAQVCAIPGGREGRLQGEPAQLSGGGRSRRAPNVLESLRRRVSRPMGLRHLNWPGSSPSLARTCADRGAIIANSSPSPMPAFLSTSIACSAPSTATAYKGCSTPDRLLILTRRPRSIAILSIKSKTGNKLRSFRCRNARRPRPTALHSRRSSESAFAKNCLFGNLGQMRMRCARFLVAIVLWAGPAVGAMRRLILSRDWPRPRNSSRCLMGIALRYRSTPE